MEGSTINYEIRVVTLMGELLEKKKMIERVDPGAVEIMALLDATTRLLVDVNPDPSNPVGDAVVLEDLLALTLRYIDGFIDSATIERMMPAMLWLWQLNTALRVRRTLRPPPPRFPLSDRG